MVGVDPGALPESPQVGHVTEVSIGWEHSGRSRLQDVQNDVISASFAGIFAAPGTRRKGASAVAVSQLRIAETGELGSLPSSRPKKRCYREHPRARVKRCRVHPWVPRHGSYEQNNSIKCTGHDATHSARGGQPFHQPSV